MQSYQNSLEHLFDELHRVDLLLNMLALRRQCDPVYAGFNEFRGLFISEEEIDAILGKKKKRINREQVQEETEIHKLHSTIKELEKQIANKVMAAADQGVHLSLIRLAQIFNLSTFDIEVLLICLAPEFDLKYEKLYAYLQNDVTRKSPGVDLILNLLCPSIKEKLQARTRLIPEAPLFRHHFVTYESNGHKDSSSLLSRFLKMDDRIVHYLLDIDTMDAQLLPFMREVYPRAFFEDLILPANLKESLHFAQLQIIKLCKNEECNARVFIFHGPSGVGKKFTAEAMCKSAGINLLIVDLPQMLSNDSRVESLVPRLLREARLRYSAVYFEYAEPLFMEKGKEAYSKSVLTRALEEFPGVLFIGSEEPWDSNFGLHNEFLLKIAFSPPDYLSRKQHWQNIFMNGNYRVSQDIDYDALTDRFKLTVGKIRRAVSEARHLAMIRSQGKEYEIRPEDLYRACQAQASIKLGTLAKKITPLYTWDDIILPSDRLKHLKEICIHARYQHQVFSEWGFNQKISLGKGLSVLFVGPSGTGKTMAAEIIAGEFRLELYKIDLSGVVSKYIGETEKNLKKIFQEAEQANIILFFDEADAIFGRRSEVKDSHDRYANIEINYLLQKMEEYKGIVILASNFQKNIDKAFTRRLRFIVEFPFPDEDYRYRIWKVVFPKDIPLGDDIDWSFLAKKLKITGGNIKNIALSAAFFAAEDSGVINMEYIIRATKREFQKMGKLCVKVDFEQYFDLVENVEVPL